MQTNMDGKENIYITISTPNNLHKYIKKALEANYESDGSVKRFSLQTVKTSISLKRMLENKNLKKDIKQGSGS